MLNTSRTITFRTSEGTHAKSGILWGYPISQLIAIHRSLPQQNGGVYRFQLFFTRNRVDIEIRDESVALKMWTMFTGKDPEWHKSIFIDSSVAAIRQSSYQNSTQQKKPS